MDRPLRKDVADEQIEAWLRIFKDAVGDNPTGVERFVDNIVLDNNTDANGAQLLKPTESERFMFIGRLSIILISTDDAGDDTLRIQSDGQTGSKGDTDINGIRINTDMMPVYYDNILIDKISITDASISFTGTMANVHLDGIIVRY
jgi:hypothetical protein